MNRCIGIDSSHASALLHRWFFPHSNGPQPSEIPGKCLPQPFFPTMKCLQSNFVVVRNAVGARTAAYRFVSLFDKQTAVLSPPESFLVDISNMQLLEVALLIAFSYTLLQNLFFLPNSYGLLVPFKVNGREFASVIFQSLFSFCTTFSIGHF